MALCQAALNREPLMMNFTRISIRLLSTLGLAAGQGQATAGCAHDGGDDVLFWSLRISQPGVSVGVSTPLPRWWCTRRRLWCCIRSQFMCRPGWSTRRSTRPGVATQCMAATTAGAMATGRSATIATTAASAGKTTAKGAGTTPVAARAVIAADMTSAAARIRGAVAAMAAIGTWAIHADTVSSVAVLPRGRPCPRTRSFHGAH
jgi:hypothetical protein